jgi:polysaccharide biosynthesis/export protein
VVLLALTSQRPVQVTVTGEVARPGLYPLQQQGTKISSLLLAVGGTREGADLRSVKVRRPLGDGQFVEETLDLFTPLKTGTPLPDPKLQDGDTIVVPRLTEETAKTYDRNVVARSTLVKPENRCAADELCKGWVGADSVGQWQYPGGCLSEF